MSESDPQEEVEPIAEGPRGAPLVRPKIITSKKKTVFVFAKPEGEAEEAEDEEDDSDDFYDFTEIEGRYRIINDLEEKE